MKTISSILTIVIVFAVTKLSFLIYLFISGYFSSPKFSIEKTLLFDFLFYLIPFVLAFLSGILVKTFLWINQIRNAKIMLWLSALSLISGTIGYLAHETIDAGYFCIRIIMNGLLDASIWGIVIFFGFVIAIELFFGKEEDLFDEQEAYR